MDGKLAVLGIVLALVGIVLVLKRRQGRYKPLSRIAAPTPSKPDLGMEATDLPSVQHILDRNSALARKTGASGQGSWTEVGATDSQRPAESAGNDR